jgi:hypothetical protein
LPDWSTFWERHPQLSFVAVFLLALSEAVPVIGTVVPGSTLILAISALATTAGITPWALLGAAVAGAIVGPEFEAHTVFITAHRSVTYINLAVVLSQVNLWAR